MCLRINVFMIYLLLTLCFINAKETFERIKLFSTERPHAIFVSPKHFKFFNVTAFRYGRHDPVYYCNIHFESTVDLGNGIHIGFYFYEFLSNTYQRSFAEITGRICVLWNKDRVITPMIKKALFASYPDIKCPIPKGTYLLQNMTLRAEVLPHFPFQKGRIYLNATVYATGELIVNGYIDFEIKEYKIKKTLN